MFDNIETIEQGIARLSHNLRKQPNVVVFLTSFLKQVNELTTAIVLVNDYAHLLNAYGQQLDYEGAMVGLERESGQGDNEYRVLIYAKIGQNISNGSPKTLKTIFKLITGGTRTQYREDNDGFSILTNGDFDESLLDSYLLTLSKIKQAGNRVERLGKMYGSDGFAFAGNLAGKGFNEGKLAYSTFKKYPFTFAGSNSNGRGFSLSSDPYEGGVLG